MTVVYLLHSGGVMLVHDIRKNESNVIDFRETAPLSITKELMLNVNQSVNVYSYLLSCRLCLLTTRNAFIDGNWAVFCLSVRSVSGHSGDAPWTTSGSSAVWKVHLFDRELTGSRHMIRADYILSIKKGRNTLERAVYIIIMKIT